MVDPLQLLAAFAVGLAVGGAVLAATWHRGEGYPLVAGFLVFGGLIFGVGMFASWRNGVASEDWPEARGVVTGSTVEERVHRRKKGSARRKYAAEIHYRFDVDGQRYTSSNVTYGPGFGEHETREAAEEEAERYPVGRQVTVYYDPADPAGAACLIRGYSTFTPLGMGGAFGAALAGLLGVVVVLVPKDPS